MHKRIVFDFGITIDEFQIQAQRTDVFDRAWSIARQQIEQGQAPKYIFLDLEKKNA